MRKKKEEEGEKKGTQIQNAIQFLLASPSADVHEAISSDSFWRAASPLQRYSPRLQQVTFTAEHSAAFERRRGHRLIHGFSNRRAPLSDSERITAVCSLHGTPFLLHAQETRGEGTSGEKKQKQQKSTNFFLFCFFYPRFFHHGTTQTKTS